MDFRSRGTTRPAATPASSSSNSFSSSSSSSVTPPKSSEPAAPKTRLWLQKSAVILLFSVTIVIVALAGLAAFGGNSQADAVKKDSYQAVFLNNGLVYFGKIQDLTKSYINLNNIYYLQTSGTATDKATTEANTSSSVQLVKLGCELHGPYDRMIINEDQVLFWENLQGSSQVAKAIAQYQKDNPKGQTCSTTTNSTQQAPSTSTQSSTTPSAGTTSGTTTKTP